MARFSKTPESHKANLRQDLRNCLSLGGQRSEPVNSCYMGIAAQLRINLGQYSLAAQDLESAIAGISGTKYTYMVPYYEKSLDRLNRQLSGLQHSDTRRSNWLKALQIVEKRWGRQHRIRDILGFETVELVSRDDLLDAAG